MYKSLLVLFSFESPSTNKLSLKSKKVNGANSLNSGRETVCEYEALRFVFVFNI